MKSFPKSFKFGWSQAGFQSEMGTFGSEDKNSDWYKWVHDPENIHSGLVSGTLPDDGAAYWANYEKFHSNARKIGFKIARIGVEWSRIFPRSTQKIKVPQKISISDLKKLDKIANQDAVNHYLKIFKDLKKNNISLIINLTHYTLPLWVHDPIKVRDGNLNDKIGWADAGIIEEFRKYAAYVAWRMDHVADQYSTMNEPDIMAMYGYLNMWSGFPPSCNSKKMFEGVIKNLIAGHNCAYQTLKQITKKPVGIVYSNTSFEAQSKKDESAINIAEKEMRWDFIDSIKNHLDWIGVNYYFRTKLKKEKSGYSLVSGYGSLCKPNSLSKDNRPVSDFGWEYYPEGIYDVLMKYWKRYNLPIYVTENGIADSKDKLRPNFIVQSILNVHKAMEDGADIRAYMHWSLADNYEWAAGDKMRFGLLGVDYKTKELQWRESASIMKEITKANVIPKNLGEFDRIPRANQSE